jgi:hypothetical protein
MIEYRDRGGIFVDQRAIHVDLGHLLTLRACDRQYVKGIWRRWLKEAVSRQTVVFACRMEPCWRRIPMSL